MLPATRHKRTPLPLPQPDRPVLGTRILTSTFLPTGFVLVFVHPRRMEGWVDLGSLIAARPGIEPTTAWSEVRRPNRYVTKSPEIIRIRSDPQRRIFGNRCSRVLIYGLNALPVTKPAASKHWMIWYVIKIGLNGCWLMTNMFSHLWRRRLTVYEALDHPWLATEHPELTNRIPASRYKGIRNKIKEKYVSARRRRRLCVSCCTALILSFIGIYLVFNLWKMHIISAKCSPTSKQAS